MSMITQIFDHVVQAKNRLLRQYKDKPYIEGMVEAFVSEFQNIEASAFDMFTSQALDYAVGTQLDNFGKIVVQGREGFDDDFYRILLRAKIGINNSSGLPSDVINTAQLLTQATLVHNQNLGNGNIGLGVDTDIDPSFLDFIFTNLEKTIAAGCRIAFLVSFDPDESFSFDGVGPIGLGFSSLAAPLTGGKLAYLNRRTGPKFAFGSIGGVADPSGSGFGAIADPLAGGIMVGL